MALDITDTDVYAAVLAFITLVVGPSVEILQGQQNRVAPPLDPFVLMTALGAERIGTNTDGTTPVLTSGVVTGFTASVSADYRYRVQVDFYGGAEAEAWATSAELLWRDGIAFDSMPSNIKPIYSERLEQNPLIDAEHQWRRRWCLLLVLDYRPTWTQPTEAATGVTVGVEPIEVFYPDATWTADSGQTASADSGRSP
jgi:hypothetical protein